MEAVAAMVRRNTRLLRLDFSRALKREVAAACTAARGHSFAWAHRASPTTAGNMGGDAGFAAVATALKKNRKWTKLQAMLLSRA